MQNAWIEMQAIPEFIVGGEYEHVGPCNSKSWPAIDRIYPTLRGNVTSSYSLQQKSIYINKMIVP